MSRISVVGAGYVGLVTGASLASLGHDVTLVENNERRLDALRQGRLPIYEPELDNLVAENRGLDRLRFTNDYEAAIAHSEFAFIAVHTPPLDSGAANTQFVFECAESIAACAPPGLVIVVKSTVPVGTADEIERRLHPHRPDIAVVSNPEFLRQGTAVRDFLAPDRIVVGAVDEEAAARVTSLFGSIDAPYIQCNRRAAELGKYAANALLATRISFMNEIASVCEAVEADIEDVADVLRLDPRIGSSYLRPGFGWGGSCFPKDVRALSALARTVGQETPIIDAAFTINQRQRESALSKVLGALNGTSDATVGVLGLAFKPDTDDLREAPAVDLIRNLQESGVQVRAHDPVAIDNARAIFPDVDYCREPEDVAHQADVVVLATEWSQYTSLDWVTMRESMRGRTVLDGRHVLDRAHLESLGFTYLSFGRFRGTRPTELPAAV